MTKLERTLVAAIAAGMLASPGFAQASHRRDANAMPSASPAAIGGCSCGCDEAQENVD